MTDEPKVDTVASAISTAATELLAAHKGAHVVDLGAVMAALTPPPGPTPPETPPAA